MPDVLVQLVVYLPTELKKRLAMRAQLTGRSQSEIVRRALYKFLGEGEIQ